MGAKYWLACAMTLAGSTVLADPAQVVGVKIQAAGSGTSFAVTLRHGDTGWDDYADGWRVELADGTIIGTRVLHHPHVNEQPFTRSLGGLSIPDGTANVFIRAKTLPEGWATTATKVKIP